MKTKLFFILWIFVISLSCSALVYQRIIPELKDRRLYPAKDGLIYQYCEVYCRWFQSCSCKTWKREVYTLEKDGERLREMGFSCQVIK